MSQHWKFRSPVLSHVGCITFIPLPAIYQRAHRMRSQRRFLPIQPWQGKTTAGPLGCRKFSSSTVLRQTRAHFPDANFTLYKMYGRETKAGIWLLAAV